MTWNVRLRQQLMARPELIPIGLLVVTWLTLALFEPRFLSLANLGNMFAFIPEFGIIALGTCLLLTAGVFDLSVGAVFGFTALAVGLILIALIVYTMLFGYR